MSEQIQWKKLKISQCNMSQASNRLRQFGKQPRKVKGDNITIMQTKNKKHTEEYEAEVVRKLRGIEEARAERELKESQDERAQSFANSFESGELTSQSLLKGSSAFGEHHKRRLIPGLFSRCRMLVLQRGNRPGISRRAAARLQTVWRWLVKDQLQEGLWDHPVRNWSG